MHDSGKNHTLPVVCCVAHPMQDGRQVRSCEMKLGLITDIHEQVHLLEPALKRLRDERVDQVVVIGDIFECGERIQETCQLLADAQAVGVPYHPRSPLHGPLHRVEEGSVEGVATGRHCRSDYQQNAWKQQSDGAYH